MKSTKILVVLGAVVGVLAELEIGLALQPDQSKTYPARDVHAANEV